MSVSDAPAHVPHASAAPLLGFEAEIVSTYGTRPCSVMLTEPRTVHGVRFRAGELFLTTEGRPFRGHLDGTQVVGGVVCQDGSEIALYRHGALRRAVLGAPLQLALGTIPKGSVVEFSRTGSVSVLRLLGATMLEDLSFPSCSVVQLHENGRVSVARLTWGAEATTHWKARSPVEIEVDGPSRCSFHDHGRLSGLWSEGTLRRLGPLQFPKGWQVHARFDRQGRARSFVRLNDDVCERVPPVEGEAPKPVQLRWVPLDPAMIVDGESWQLPSKHWVLLDDRGMPFASQRETPERLQLAVLPAADLLRRVSTVTIFTESWPGSFEVDQEGRLAMAQLADAFSMWKAHFPAGSSIKFREDRRVVALRPTHMIELRKNLVSAPRCWVEFHDNGHVASFVPACDAVIDGIPCSRGNPITESRVTLSPGNRLRSTYLAIDWPLPDVPIDEGSAPAVALRGSYFERFDDGRPRIFCPKEPLLLAGLPIRRKARVVLHPSGTPASAKLLREVVVDGHVVPAGTRVELDPEGRLERMTFSRQVSFEGRPYGPGESVTVHAS